MVMDDPLSYFVSHAFGIYNIYMNKDNKTMLSNFSKVDVHIIKQEEYEELPELTDEMLESADFYYGKNLIRRGRRPSKKT